MDGNQKVRHIIDFNRLDNGIYLSHVFININLKLWVVVTNYICSLYGRIICLYLLTRLDLKVLFYS